MQIEWKYLTFEIFLALQKNFSQPIRLQQFQSKTKADKTIYLVGPTVTSLVQDHQTVLNLDNRLCMFLKFCR